MSETTTTTDPTPAAPPVKWYEQPWVKVAVKYGLIILVTFLASKGIKLPFEAPPLVVNVSYPVHEPAKP